jgi:hypothetical protein
LAAINLLQYLSGRVKACRELPAMSRSAPGAARQWRGVGKGYLHLRKGAAGAKNGHAGDGALRADHIHALLAGVLAGLGELLFIMKLRARAKQFFQNLLSDVHMARRRFYNKFLAHAETSINDKIIVLICLL